MKSVLSRLYCYDGGKTFFCISCSVEVFKRDQRTKFVRFLGLKVHKNLC